MIRIVLLGQHTIFLVTFFDTSTHGMDNTSEGLAAGGISFGTKVSPDCYSGNFDFSAHYIATFSRFQHLASGAKKQIVPLPNVNGPDKSRFQFSNPNPRAYTVTPGPVLEVDWSDNSVFDEARERHEEETTKRIQWCIANNLQPESNKHLAPGDDNNFMVA